MSPYSEMANLSSDMAKEICKNEKVEKFASGAASTILGGIVHGVTGSKTAGDAAKAVTGGLARSHSKEVAEVVTTVGMMVVTSAASVLFIPGLICYGIYSAIFKQD